MTRFMVLTVVGRSSDALQHRESSIYAHDWVVTTQEPSPPESLSAMLPLFAAEPQHDSEILHRNSPGRLRASPSEDKGSIRKRPRSSRARRPRATYPVPAVTLR